MLKLHHQEEVDSPGLPPLPGKPSGIVARGCARCIKPPQHTPALRDENDSIRVVPRSLLTTSSLLTKVSAFLILCDVWAGSLRPSNSAHHGGKVKFTWVRIRCNRTCCNNWSNCARKLKQPWRRLIALKQPGRGTANTWAPRAA